jgi:AcrR family transcriptional regulator
VTIRIDAALRDDPDQTTDGRAARREKNRLAAIDAAIELFSEDNLQPGLDEIAQRSGLSSKSVHRYFENSQALLSAAIRRQLEVGYLLYYIHAIGEGPPEDRIDSFVSMRLKAHEEIGATARAATFLATRSAQVRENFDRVRRLLQEQIEIHFAQELDALPKLRRQSRVAAIDALVQFESLDYFRVRRGLSLAETQSILADALKVLLDCEAKSDA